MNHYKDEIPEIEHHSFFDRADVTQDYHARMEKLYKEREEFSHWYFNYEWRTDGTCIIYPMPYNPGMLNDVISNRADKQKTLKR